MQAKAMPAGWRAKPALLRPYHGQGRAGRRGDLVVVRHDGQVAGHGETAVPCPLWRLDPQQSAGVAVLAVLSEPLPQPAAQPWSSVLTPSILPPHAQSADRESTQILRAEHRPPRPWSIAYTITLEVALKDRTRPWSPSGTSA
ncbi:hypothetical protein [Streptomyces chrestomyceticus]|uniref:hypothetical protein n=1 Tax=Streptomyces chrestomyceticus TaxID=68185 RepID=UPI00378E5D6B